MPQSIRIEWVFGKPPTGAEDDAARGIKAAMEVLDKGGTEYVRAERGYISAVHRGGPKPRPTRARTSSRASPDFGSRRPKRLMTP
jgi:hypothetical protein